MKLSAYMKRENLPWEAMADLIGDCSVGGLRKWVSGDRIPTREAMERIFIATNGEVTPNDFYELGIPESVTASEPAGSHPAEIGA